MWFLFIGVSCPWWSLSVEIEDKYRLLGFLLIAVIFLKAWRCHRIPVLTFHSVSGQGKWLKMPDLVVPVNIFECELKWLKNHGYKSLTMDELYDARQKKDVKGKVVALTFDDGFLDAWVAVAPLLTKYGLKGTVFVSTGWIEDDGPPRPQIDTISSNGIRWEGYLNHSEIRLLKEGGVLDVQSHGVTHDRIFCDSRIRDFVTDDNCPLWLYLLLFPENRISWHKKKLDVPTGYPVFSSGEALAVGAFYPNLDFIRTLADLAGRKGFFKGKNWRRDLINTADEFLQSNKEPGRKEGWAETLDRWRDELVQSKQKLEQISGGPVSHLCWPRSAWHKDSESLALESGYRSTTAGRCHNSIREPRRVSRVHISAIGWYPLDLTRFVLEIWVFKGHYWAWPVLWVIQKIMMIVLKHRKGILT